MTIPGIETVWSTRDSDNLKKTVEITLFRNRYPELTLKSVDQFTPESALKNSNKKKSENQMIMTKKLKTQPVIRATRSLDDGFFMQELVYNNSRGSKREAEIPYVFRARGGSLSARLGRRTSRRQAPSSHCRQRSARSRTASLSRPRSAC